MSDPQQTHDRDPIVGADAEPVEPPSAPAEPKDEATSAEASTGDDDSTEPAVDPDGTSEQPRPTNVRRRPDSPRRVRNGLRVKLKLADETPPWPANAWFDALVAEVPPAVRTEGLAYAKAGQIVLFGIEPPQAESDPVRLVATVQGRSPRPYETQVDVASWRRDRWEAVIDAMAREAMYAANLVGGEVPQAIDELVSRLGHSLLPDRDELSLHCTCAEGAPCKHTVAVACLLAERLVESPLTVFTLRGMPGDEVVQRLHEARALQTRGMATAHSASPLRDVSARPFAECLQDFWRPGHQLAEVEHAERDEHVPHALLRRLGPSPLQGKFPLVGLLASIYDSVRKGAQSIAGEGGADEGNGDGDR